MRRVPMLLICVLGTVAAVPHTAAAGHRHFPFPRAMALPLQMMFGHGVRARHHRHRVVSRPRRAGHVARTSPAREQRAAVAQFWPTAYGDLLEPVLWPGDGDRFWIHGFADVLDSIFARSANTAREEDSCTKNASATQAADELSNRLQKDIQPTRSQSERLSALRTAFAAAFERIRSTCSDTARTPSERLRAIVDRLLAMRQALLIVRGPLEHFYDSLDDAQKARLDAAQDTDESRSVNAAQDSDESRSAGRSDSDVRARIASAETAQADPRLAALSGLCASQMGAIGAWPSDQIERDLKPTKEQRFVFEGVQMVSGKMGQFLAASCPQAIPATPLDRLSAASERLNAMFYAASIMNRPVGAFYDSLDERQRARFRQLRPEGRATTAER